MHRPRALPPRRPFYTLLGAALLGLLLLLNALNPISRAKLLEVSNAVVLKRRSERKAQQQAQQDKQGQLGESQRRDPSGLQAAGGQLGHQAQLYQVAPPQGRGTPFVQGFQPALNSGGPSLLGTGPLQAGAYGTPERR